MTPCAHKSKKNTSSTTSGVNLINNLCAHFSYKSAFCQNVTRKKMRKALVFWRQNFIQKTGAYNVDEIDGSSVMGSIGGHLGLFLGISCMNIILFGVQLITNWIGF